MTRRLILFLLLGAALAALASYAFAALKITDALAAEIQSCAADPHKKQACYQQLVETSAQEGGIARGLDALAMLYELDREFATFCHGSTHELGKMAYDLFKEGSDFSVNPKTSYCGFGFYHGFLEAMLYDQGDLSQATEFCEYVDTALTGEINGVSFACYHGIGHGVVDGTDTASWGNVTAYIEPGLAMCESLPTDVLEHKTRCASGVFNALAIAYVDPKYRLSPDPEDPYAICRDQDLPYARKACYDQMNGYVNIASGDFQNALTKAYETSEPAYRELAVETTAGYRVLDAIKGVRPLSEFIEDCAVLPDSFAQLCVRGFAASLIEHGKPKEEYKEALAACKKSGAMQEVCLKGITLGVYDRLPPDMRESLCEDIRVEIGDAAGQECVRIMSGRRVQS